MRNLTRLMLAVLVLLAAETSGGSGIASAAPPTWSFQRASLSVDAKGGVFDKDDAQRTAFLPGIALSYSATSQLSLVGTIERDFPEHLSIGQAGMRFLVFQNDRGQLAGGLNAVFYGDDGAAIYEKPTSWNGGIFGSWAAARAKNGQTILFAIASATRDVENDLTLVRIGLRYQVIGGRP